MICLQAISMWAHEGYFPGPGLGWALSHGKTNELPPYDHPEYDDRPELIEKLAHVVGIDLSDTEVNEILDG